MQLKKLRDCPALLEQAALWFNEKWGVPVEAYRESIAACMTQKTGVPQWYLVTDETGTIRAGAGVIENDFHDRKDLAPNLCALYVEEAFRKQGLARFLLDAIRNDFANMGIEQLYLITDHTQFYEKCGWTFFTMVQSDEGILMRLYTAKNLPNR